MNSLQYAELVSSDLVGYKVSKRVSEKAHLSRSWLEESDLTVSRSISLYAAQSEAESCLVSYIDSRL
jgi:hypothetical protein